MSGLTITGIDKVEKMLKSLAEGSQQIAKTVSDFAEGNVSDALDKVVRKWSVDPKTIVQSQVRRMATDKVMIQVRIQTERGAVVIRRITYDVKRAMQQAVSQTVTEAKDQGIAKGQVS